MYVYTVVSLEDLLSRVARIADGTVDLWTVVASGFEIAGLKNDEFEEDRAMGGGGDFLYFPYMLEVEEVEPLVDRASALKFVVNLLDGLRGAGIDFVTAADFEDELPYQGRSRA